MRREPMVARDLAQPVGRRRRERRDGGRDADRQREGEDEERARRHHASASAWTRGAAATRSGRADRTAPTAATVITASPAPISAWTPSIAGRTVPSGIVPETASSAL